MNNSNNNVDNQYLLNVPVAYILQNKSIEEIEQDFDSNGWSILHHAVAEADMGKIKELIHFSFNWTVNGNSNVIPEVIYQFNEKRKATRVRTLKRMPYCSKGYSPIHLALFLFNHYNDLYLNGDHGYITLSNSYKDILNALINITTAWYSVYDSDGNSLSDYAFLLESYDLIEDFYLKEPTFSSLKKVSPAVAKKIIEIMRIKGKRGDFDPILAALDNKLLNESLKNDLKINSTSKKTIQKL